jgi:hypothetical protein
MAEGSPALLQESSEAPAGDSLDGTGRQGLHGLRVVEGSAGPRSDYALRSCTWRQIPRVNPNDGKRKPE